MLLLMKRGVKGRREEETEFLVSSPPVKEILIEQGCGKAKADSEGLSRADGLLGRMQAKGIVGNYMGLE